MALTLEITKANGTVIANPLTQPWTRVSVLPGDTVKVVDAATGKSPVNLRVKKMGESLMVEGLPDGQVVELNNFYSACSTGASCALEIDAIGSGAAPTMVTPATQPVALLSSGQALMYGADPGAASLAPSAAGGMAASPAMIGGALLGVAAVGAAVGGGGGSGGTRDSLAPAAPIVARALQTSADAVTVSGTAEPNTTVAVQLGSVTQNVVADGNGQWSTSFDARGLADGTFQVSATAADGAGNVSPSSASQTVVVDRTPPAAPAIAAAITTGAGDVEVRGTAEAGSQVRVALAGSERTVGVGSDGQWAVVFAGAATAMGAQAQAAVVAVDAVGNASAAASQTVRIVGQADTTPPDAPTIASAAQQASGEVRIAGTSDAGDTVLVSLGAASRSVVADSFGNWAVTFARASLSGGSLTMSARATDAAGNQGPATAATAVVVDLTAPAAPVNLQAGLGQVINAQVLADPSGFTITGDAEPGSRVVVTFGSITYAAVQADASTGRWTLTVPQGAPVPADGADVKVTAVATDAFGNASAASTPFSVEVDRIAPAAPRGLTLINGRLSGLAEPGSHVLIDIGNNGTPSNPSIDLPLALADSTGRWTTGPIGTPLPAGTVISVQAQDDVNNSSPERLFTVSDVAVGGSVATLTGNASSNLLIGDDGGGVRNGRFQFWDLRDTASAGGADRTGGWGGLSGFMDPASLGWTILDEGAMFSGGPTPVFGTSDPDTFGGQVMGSYYIGGFGVPGPGTDGHSFIAYTNDANNRSQGWDTAVLHEVGGGGLEQRINTTPGETYTLTIDVSGLTGSAASFKIYFGESATPIATFNGTGNTNVGAWTGSVPTGANTGTNDELWSWAVTATEASSRLRIETFIGTNTLTNDPGMRVREIDLQATTPAAAQTISGGAGADVIYGQGGNDVLYGGAAGTPDTVRDTFVYSMRSANGDDVIRDFDVTHDRLVLIDVLDVDGVSVTPDSALLANQYADLNLDGDDVAVAGGQRLVIDAATPGGDLRFSFFRADGGTALGTVTLDGVTYDPAVHDFSSLVSSGRLALTGDGFSDRLLMDATPQGHLIA